MLSTATELIVAPRSRHAQPVEKPSTHDLSAASSRPSVTSAATAEWEQARKRLLRLLPAGMQPREAQAEQAGLEHTVYVCRALYDTIRRAFPGESRMTLGHFMRPLLHKPSGPAPATGAADHAEGSGAAEAEHQDPSSAGEQAAHAQVAEVRVSESRDVPAAHIWISTGVRREIGLQADDAFALIK